MAVLPEADRRACWIAIMRQLSRLGSDCVPTKTELRLALDAVDNWVDANAASYNSAIPQPARASLTPAQKALLLAYVCLRRAGELRIDEDG